MSRRSNSSSSNSSNPMDDESSDSETALLRTLMSRLQLRPPYLNTNSFLSQPLDSLFLDYLLNNSPSDPQSPEFYDDEEEEEDGDDVSEKDRRAIVAKEESKLEKEIIRTILTGKSDSLKPNSGQAVAIGDHHICVGFHDESGSDYRVWEWHGHIMLFDDEDGYSPEYIYGNYFERRLPFSTTATTTKKEEEDEEEEEEEEEEEVKEGVNVGNLGLRELIGDGDLKNGRILRRNLQTGSKR